MLQEVPTTDRERAHVRRVSRNSLLVVSSTKPRAKKAYMNTTAKKDGICGRTIVQPPNECPARTTLLSARTVGFAFGSRETQLLLSYAAPSIVSSSTELPLIKSLKVEYVM